MQRSAPNTTPAGGTQGLWAHTYTTPRHMCTPAPHRISQGLSTLSHARAASGHLQLVGEVGQGAQGTLASGQRLHTEAKEGNHRQAAVLDLGGLQLEGALVVTGDQVQGVKHTACRDIGQPRLLGQSCIELQSLATGKGGGSGTAPPRCMYKLHVFSQLSISFPISSLLGEAASH